MQINMENIFIFLGLGEKKSFHDGNILFGFFATVVDSFGERVLTAKDSVGQGFSAMFEQQKDRFCIEP